MSSSPDPIPAKISPKKKVFAKAKAKKTAAKSAKSAAAAPRGKVHGGRDARKQRKVLQAAVTKVPGHGDTKGRKTKK